MQSAGQSVQSVKGFGGGSCVLRIAADFLRGSFRVSPTMVLFDSQPNDPFW